MAESVVGGTCCPCCDQKGSYLSDAPHASTFFCDNRACRVASYETRSLEDREGDLAN